MNKIINAVSLACLLALMVLGTYSILHSEESTTDKVKKAISSLRDTDFSKVKKEDQEAKGKEIDAAWDTISSAGKTGLDLLKQEVKKTLTVKDKYDWFKLNASDLLWRIGTTNEANTITEIWNNTLLDVQYYYVFYTAFYAARTKDPKVLPMLSACLKDKKGSIFTAQHSLTIAWPLTHEFLWGAYGSAGLPAINKTLNESKDPVQQESAMLLLARAYYPEALPQIRKLAKDGSGDVKRTAIKCLGMFGHPNDYNLIISGLSSKDPDDLYASVYALYEYEDLRAVPQLEKLMNTENDKILDELLSAMIFLLTPKSVDIIHNYSKNGKNEKYKDVCNKTIQQILGIMKLSMDDYSQKSQEEKEVLCKTITDMGNAKYKLKPDDKQMTHDDLIDASKEWIKSGRLSDGSYAWVEGRHVLSAATAKDIPLLLDVKSELYLRISDECLYETRELDQLIKLLARSVYRTDVGITKKAAEPSGKK